jgi:exosortase D (VPLPA-CTERM-specific)
MNPRPAVAQGKPSIVELIEADRNVGTRGRDRLLWAAAVLPIPLIGFIYFDSLAYMVHIWVTDENYGHGFFVPLISLYFVWERRHALGTLGLRGSWWGPVLLSAGLGLYVIGELATLYVLLHLSFWLVVVAFTVGAIGLRGAREIAFPLVYLLTMIPLPDFLYQALSGRLQLLSSALGIGCLQVVGVTAFREGNVIDLGPIQLQVVEACSGLRYLFPLVALALLCAYLFRDRMWKRITLLASSIPISILLNGFRIGVIGVLVDLYGPGAAEGFLHLFEGWVLFLAGLLALLGEMWLLSRIHPAEAIAPARRESPARPAPFDRALSRGAWPRAYAVCLAVLALVAVGAPRFAFREEATPPRRSLLEFPLRVGDWTGLSYPLEREYVDVLRFDDYIMADYTAPGGGPVNFYVAYYRTQRKGRSAHSPKTCIPGGGWEIASFGDVEVAPPSAAEPGLTVNRAFIQKGDDRQLVLYWFKQRNRVLTDEYAVKAYLLWDALTQRRTDGALIRLSAPVRAGESEVGVERRLAAFAALVHPLLKTYVPD